MSAQVRIISLFSLIVLGGLFAGTIVWLSPDSLPMAHTQLLTACIALFSASGYALVRMLHPATSRKKPPIVLRDDNSEISPPKQVTKHRDAAE
jgi:hypothetical protein